MIRFNISDTLRLRIQLFTRTTTDDMTLRDERKTCLTLLHVRMAWAHGKKVVT